MKVGPEGVSANSDTQTVNSTICNREMSVAVRLGTCSLEGVEEYSGSTSRVELVLEKK